MSAIWLLAGWLAGWLALPGCPAAMPAHDAVWVSAGSLADILAVHLLVLRTCICICILDYYLGLFTTWQLCDQQEGIEGRDGYAPLTAQSW